MGGQVFQLQNGIKGHVRFAAHVVQLRNLFIETVTDKSYIDADDSMIAKNYFKIK
jgi:hypothetical protein